MTTLPISRQNAEVTTGVNRTATHAMTSISRNVEGAWVSRKKSKSSTATAAAVAPTNVATSAPEGRGTGERPLSRDSANHPPRRSPNSPNVAMADSARVPRPMASDRVSSGMISSPNAVRMSEYTMTPMLIASRTRPNSGRVRIVLRPPPPQSWGTHRRIRRRRRGTAVLRAGAARTWPRDRAGPPDDLREPQAQGGHHGQGDVVADELGAGTGAGQPDQSDACRGGDQRHRELARLLDREVAAVDDEGEEEDRPGDQAQG